MERWPVRDETPLRFLVHRSRPEWLEAKGADVRPIDLADSRGLRAALSGTTCVINLLRPDGTGWLKAAIQQLLPALGQVSVSRLVHVSSIDVYGGTHASCVTEETRPEPGTAYEREHFEIEKIVECAPFETCIVRPGAIFGPGGRNLVAFVPEMRNAPFWRLVARRSLYGRRRMHLVSVENVADAIRAVATPNGRTLVGPILVTDDESPENNFAFLQETMARIFGRPALGWVPELPSFALRAALRARGRTNANPMRRFSNDKLLEIGFRPEQSFATRLVRYITFLRDALESPPA
jgi:nucleoside-diphosphate-sugar epimerase